MDSQVTLNLIAARALIATPEKWLKGMLDNNAGCYCAMGAVRQIAVQPEHQRLWRVSQTDEYKLLCRALPKPYFGIPGFNDARETTHADVLALFDRAIALSRAPHTSALTAD